MKEAYIECVLFEHTIRGVLKDHDREEFPLMSLRLSWFIFFRAVLGPGNQCLVPLSWQPACKG